jgi:hypothetical protein
VASEPVTVHVPLEGLYSSVDAVGANDPELPVRPPETSTFPVVNRVADACVTANGSDPVLVHSPVDGM